MTVRVDDNAIITEFFVIEWWDETDCSWVEGDARFGSKKEARRHIYNKAAMVPKDFPRIAFRIRSMISVKGVDWDPDTHGRFGYPPAGFWQRDDLT